MLLNKIVYVNGSYCSQLKWIHFIPLAPENYLFYISAAFQNPYLEDCPLPEISSPEH